MSIKTGNAPDIGVIRLVTPDGLEVEYEAAGVGLRICAKLVDLAILGVASLVVGMMIALVSGDGETTPTIAIVIGYFWFFFLLFGYAPIFESLRGATLGKSMVGLRVISLDGRPPTFRQALLRAISEVFETYATLGLVSLIAAIVSRRYQRLGDVLANTGVISTNPKRPPLPVNFSSPPGFERAVSLMDVSRLSASDYSAIRTLLFRAQLLPADIRIQRAGELAVALRKKVNVSLPPNVHPETFLACLATAYQQRSDRTLLSRAKTRERLLGRRVR